MFDYDKKMNELYDIKKEVITYDSSYFKLPIEYNDPGYVNDIIKIDIELLPDNNIYKNIIPNSILVDKWSSYYTNNKKFLKDTQSHIKHYKSTLNNRDMLEEYKLFKEETSFIERYQYVGLKWFRPLNENTAFLQCLGLFNLASPVISLCSPIFVLIVPFIILKIRGIPITIDMYIKFLTELIKKNSFYKLFTEFSTLPAQQKMSSIVSILFYIFQVYSNVMSCITFYKNINSVSTFLFKYKDHVHHSIELIHNLQASTSNYKTYTSFYNEMELHKLQLKKQFLMLNTLIPFDNTISKITQIGVYMKIYYELFYSEQHHKTFMYSVYLNQYNSDISELNKQIKSKKLNKCKYGKLTKMKNIYYLPHINNNPIKNDVVLDKNIIITGPNASGKTTMIKSILINVLLSQQIGYGCYSSAKIKLYDTFHSYLNIPDTSGRDSLFQAEARRCKDILENISKNPKAKHLCIFDEIYSGTNPNDAVMCADMYLKGMNKLDKSVDYVLTTHYIELCEKFKENTLIKNLKMNVEIDKEDITFLYTIVPGISYVHGGKHILKEMEYPDHLFNNQ
uniref:DNA mismatch repair proteins mutS family domain-containing protein n=1 Tax=viral metagenome TaxID=1070528 RepID=A0A6C0JPR3_9ZZZZ